MFGHVLLCLLTRTQHYSHSKGRNRNVKLQHYCDDDHHPHSNPNLNHVDLCTHFLPLVGNCCDSGKMKLWG